MKTKNSNLKCASKGLLSSKNTNKRLKKNRKAVKNYSSVHSLHSKENTTQSIVLGKSMKHNIIEWD